MSDITREQLIELGFTEVKGIGFDFYRKQGDKFPVLSIHIGPVTLQAVAVVSNDLQSMSFPIKTIEDVRKIMENMGLIL